MARARRRAPGDGDRARPAASRRERCVRERDAVPRPRLRRHALGLRLARLDGDRTRRPRRRGAVRRRAARHAGRDRRRERDRLPGRHGRRRARFHARGFHPTAICGVFGGVARGRRGSPASTPRRRRVRSESPARWPSGLFAYLADGTPTKPIHPAWAAHGAHLATRLAAPRGRRAAGPCSRASSASTTPSSAPSDGRDRHRRPARRPRRALGDAADRLQAVPGLPFHARRRSVRRRTRSRTDVRAGRDRRRRS